MDNIQKKAYIRANQRLPRAILKKSSIDVPSARKTMSHRGIVEACLEHSHKAIHAGF